jgi:hypothetical protein
MHHPCGTCHVAMLCMKAGQSGAEQTQCNKERKAHKCEIVHSDGLLERRRDCLERNINEDWEDIDNQLIGGYLLGHNLCESAHSLANLIVISAQTHVARVSR